MSTERNAALIGGPTFGPIVNWFVGVSGLSRFLLWLVWGFENSFARDTGTLALWPGDWTEAHRVKDENHEE